MKDKWKGIILAGGEGTRLYPATKVISKHLIPIYDKPMIYYSLSILMLASIKEIAIISDKENLHLYKKMFGNGNELGIKLKYLVQKKPKGIGEAFTIAKNFIKNDHVALILGDNVFYGSSLREKLLNAKNSSKDASIFAYQVRDPERFGVVTLNEKNSPISIIEKPKNPKSNLAITGLYFYKNNILKYSKKIKLSSRKQYEITDINNLYLKDNQLEVIRLGRGFAWLDMGTHDSLLDASNFIKTIEKRQGTKVSCLEEFSYLNRWISKKDLIKIAKKNMNTDLGQYLISLSKENEFWK